MASSEARVRLNTQSPDETIPADERTLKATNGDQHTSTDIEKNTPPAYVHARGFTGFHRRLRGKHLTKVPSILDSILATIRATKVNFGLILIPLSIISYKLHWKPQITFARM